MRVEVCQVGQQSASEEGSGQGIHELGAGLGSTTAAHRNLMVVTFYTGAIMKT